MFPTKVEGLIQCFDGYKASDSNAGWCWSVERMVLASGNATGF
jgi:hypothetical protein